MLVEKVFTKEIKLSLKQNNSIGNYLRESDIGFATFSFCAKLNLTQICKKV